LRRKLRNKRLIVVYMNNWFGKEVDEEQGKKMMRIMKTMAGKQKGSVSSKTREITAGEEDEEVREWEVAGEQGRSRLFREEEEEEEIL
jgi:hypothetical protein